MATSITDEQIQQLAGTAKPFSLALLWWDSERHQDGAEAIELEHQRRMVSLHADGTIAVLCPGAADTLAGVAVMTVSTDEAESIMSADPAVQSGMIRIEVHPAMGFPGDTVPG